MIQLRFFLFDKLRANKIINMQFFQLERYADVHKKIRSATKTTCTPHIHQVAIKNFKETSWKTQYLHTGG